MFTNQIFSTGCFSGTLIVATACNENVVLNDILVSNNIAYHAFYDSK